jgi:hypothetical protein
MEAEMKGLYYDYRTGEISRRPFEPGFERKLPLSDPQASQMSCIRDIVRRREEALQEEIRRLRDRLERIRDLTSETGPDITGTPPAASSSNKGQTLQEG